MDDNTPKRRLRTAVLAILAAVATAIPPSVLTAAPAQAAPVVGFNAGSIIDDSLFYAGNSMDAAAVQTFLNARMPGGASSSLKNYTQTTSSKPSDRFCSAYTGAKNETAAQIIAKVGTACGISQKTILVMLQKEQSLVTTASPSTTRYDRAMGFACPDSGPGGTANCDTAYYGFFNQVWNGARQLKRYGLDDFFSWYPVGQHSNVRYHPNVDCGAQPVLIENKATAALYYYTPYTPNAAALAAGSGEGDACSSYGNRNFYNYFTSWFGSVRGHTVSGPIKEYWEKNLGWLGQPAGPERAVASSGGGKLQDFDGGFVYLKNGGSAVGIQRTSPVLAAFAAAGGIEGSWGWPTGGWTAGTMQFQKGLVVEANAKAHLVPTVLVAHWQKSGGLSGSLGAPKAEARTAKGLWSQEFAKNTIVRDAGGTIRVFDSRFLSAWKANGGVAGTWGAPKKNAASISGNGGGQSYELSGATLYRSAAGVFAISNGKLAAAYAQAGGPAGSWGWPRGRELCAADGYSCSMDFTRGTAGWTSNRGAVFTPLAVPSDAQPAKPGSDEKILGGAAQ